MKQIILTLFAILCFSLGTYAIEVDGINYDLTSAYDENDKYIGEVAYVAEGEYSGDITIPAEIQYYDEWEKKTYTYKVCKIADNAFKDNNNITSLNIQAAVKEVNVNSCANLKSLTLPNSVETIDCDYCESLTSITIPTSMTRIHSLKGCSSITSLTIPKNITTIDDYAFNGMENLKSITIEDCDDILNFEGDPFGSDSNIELLYLGRNINNTSWFKSLKSIELGVKFTKIYDEMFIYCSNLTTFTARGPITTVGKSAFLGCSSLTTINLPQSITTIEEYAFDATGLKTVNLPQSLTYIGNHAFSYSALTSIVIPENVTSIGESAFNGCSALTDIQLQNGIKTIEDNSFEECTSLTSIVIPNSITSLGKSAFKHCESLTSVTFSDNLKVIPAYAFYECTKLLSINLPEGLERIEKFAFMNDSKVTNVKLPASLKYIGPAAFSEFNKLEELHYEGQLSDWVKITFNDYDINEEGDGGSYYPLDTNPISYTKNFYLRNGMQLKDIVFTADMDSISPMAFYGYKGTIDNVTVASGIKHLRIGKNAFTGVTATNLIIGTDLQKITGALPQGKNVKYAGSMKQWCNLELTASPIAADGTINIDGQDLGTHLEIPEGITRIPSNHFCKLGFSTISLPSTLTEIADNAFNNCGNVKEIILPAQITSIGSSAFYGCDILKSVSRMEPKAKSANTLSIGNDAFAYCWYLEDINLGNIDYVGNGAFDATKWYQNQPDGLMTIGNTIYKYKGENCMPANTIINVPEGIKYISYEAFKDQTNLIGVTLPSTLQSIGKYAFYHCSLNEVSLPANITEISENAFYWNNISKLTIPSTVNKLQSHAFGNNPIEELTIDDSEQVLSIDGYQDFGTSLKRVYLGRNLEGMVNYGLKYNETFYNNSIEKLTLGKDVTEFYQDLFTCYDLKQITCLSIVPPIVDKENYLVFRDTHYQNCTLYVPAESLDAYKNAQVWKDFLNISGTATGINGVITDDKDADIIYYDLEGRKIQNPVKGHLYITNKGKKVVF